MNILDVTWLASGAVGIVKVETEYDGIKFYCGLTQGGTARSDAEHIAEWGSTVSPDEMKRFFEL